MSTDERSLADEAPEPSDVSEPAERGPLSVDEFLAGVRAVRRQVWLRPNLHLFADLERLVGEIEAAPDGADLDDLIDEYESIKARFEQSERWVVEQRSHERRRHVREQAAKAVGYTLTEDGAAVVGDDVHQSMLDELSAHEVADHVVEPEGVTGEQIRALHQASPGESNLLTSAIIRVNRVVDEKVASEVLRDFSSRRSGRTKHSTRR